jgi:hypothetical protein
MHAMMVSSVAVGYILNETHFCFELSGAAFWRSPVTVAKVKSHLSRRALETLDPQRLRVTQIRQL